MYLHYHKLKELKIFLSKFEAMDCTLLDKSKQRHTVFWSSEVLKHNFFLILDNQESKSEVLLDININTADISHIA